MKTRIIVLATLALTTPFLVAAQTSVTNISGAGQFIIDTINHVLVPVLFALAFIVFIWGAFSSFILGANDEGAKEKGKNLMIYGLIGFVVMISVWGLVFIITNSLGLSNSGPTLPTTGVSIGG